MVVRKQEILEQIQPGKAITAKLLTDIIEFVEAQKGPKGDTGEQGPAGATIQSIVLTKDADGAIIGGTATLTDQTTVPITVGLAVE